MAAREFFIKDFGWKLFSLALAVVIWVTVSTVSRQGNGSVKISGPVKERVFANLPVVIMSSASDVREFKVSPGVIAVTVSGRPEVLDALTEKEIRATVDLTEIESATDLRKRVDVSTPPGVMFVGSSPSVVEVVIPAKGDIGKSDK